MNSKNTSNITNKYNPFNFIYGLVCPHFHKYFPAFRFTQLVSEVSDFNYFVFRVWLIRHAGGGYQPNVYAVLRPGAQRSISGSLVYGSVWNTPDVTVLRFIHQVHTKGMNRDFMEIIQMPLPINTGLILLPYSISLAFLFVERKKQTYWKKVTGRTNGVNTKSMIGFSDEKENWKYLSCRIFNTLIRPTIISPYTTWTNPNCRITLLRNTLKWMDEKSHKRHLTGSSTDPTLSIWTKSKCSTAKQKPGIFIELDARTHPTYGF